MSDKFVDIPIIFIFFKAISLIFILANYPYFKISWFMLIDEDVILIFVHFLSYKYFFAYIASNW